MYMNLINSIDIYRSVDNTEFRSSTFECVIRNCVQSWDSAIFPSCTLPQSTGSIVKSYDNITTIGSSLPCIVPFLMNVHISNISVSWSWPSVDISWIQLRSAATHSGVSSVYPLQHIKYSHYKARYPIQPFNCAVARLS